MAALLTEAANYTRHVTMSRLVTRDEWLMLPGERAALEGVLSVVDPGLSIEIGTHAGGSLERVSAHSGAVHAFDLAMHPSVGPDRFPNVTFHFGDSHELLPAVLDELDLARTNVDFVLVDGDHTADGVRRDLEDLLSSPCTRETVILLHDTLNASVRLGLEKVDLDAFGTVRFVDYDFVQGQVMREGPQENELWYGLGLVVTGSEVPNADWPRHYAAPEVYAGFSSSLQRDDEISQPLGEGQLIELQREAADQKALVELMQSSVSWRLTAPLRRLRRLTRHRRR